MKFAYETAVVRLFCLKVALLIVVQVRSFPRTRWNRIVRPEKARAPRTLTVKTVLETWRKKTGGRTSTIVCRLATRRQVAWYVVWIVGCTLTLHIPF